MPTPTADLPPVRLLDRLRAQTRCLHYSIRTEEAYAHWVQAFIRFHGMRHPSEMAGPEVEAFLQWLAADRQVAVSTHRQALSALLFLYQKVLRVQLPWMAEIGRPKTERRLPVVLPHEEVAGVLPAVSLDHRLAAQLLYGTGMRLLEVMRLRVKDIDFTRRAIIVREGKGAKDRVVMLPAALEVPLRAQLGAAHTLWAADRASGLAGVHLPHALERKYRARRCRGPGSGFSRRRRPRSIRALALNGGTTPGKMPSSGPSSVPLSRPGSTSRPRRTRCIALLPICWCGRRCESAGFQPV